MAEYKNYGTIGGVGKTNVPISTKKYSLVYLATHSKELSIDYMYRSFISFTFGGRAIEEFNLIATIINNRKTGNAYAEFNDTTTSYSNLDGLQYWGTHYTKNSITFNLATDGMEEKLLDDFCNWFLAGSTKELILSEHPNRAILARVSKPPVLSLLPFESTIQFNITNVPYTTKTTLYKGEITLELVMDEPYWYAVDNILGKKVTEYNLATLTQRTYYLDRWINARGEEESIFASQDALKILYEDGIPLGSMVHNNMLLGNGAFASVENLVESCIWSTETVTWQDGVPVGSGARIDGNTADEPNYSGISIPGIYLGRIAGAIVDVSGKGIISLSSSLYGYFFYAGTAPSPAIISFDLQPMFDENGYFYSIANNDHKNNTLSYSIITIESEDKLLLKITTPNLITSYNKAITILNTCKNIINITTEEVIEKIASEVKHQVVREWVIGLLSGETNINSLPNDKIISKMSALFKDDNGNYPAMHFTFNNENNTGEAIGTFICRKLNSATTISSDDDIINKSTILNLEEDIGDMLCSNNLIIRERNIPDKFGNIVHWEDSVKGKKYSHRIYHDMFSPLKNLLILYKNMYL